MFCAYLRSQTISLSSCRSRTISSIFDSFPKLPVTSHCICGLALLVPIISWATFIFLYSMLLNFLMFCFPNSLKFMQEIWTNFIFILSRSNLRRKICLNTPERYWITFFDYSHEWCFFIGQRFESWLNFMFTISLEYRTAAGLPLALRCIFGETRSSLVLDEQF